MIKIENNLVLGDCLDILPQIPDEIFDLIIIDFPYNLGKFINLKKKEFKTLIIKWCELIIPKLKKTGSFYAFMGYEYNYLFRQILSKYLIFRRELIWHYIIGGAFRKVKNYYAEFDKILFFTKSNDYTFNILRRKPSKATLERWEKDIDKNGKIPFKKLPPHFKKHFKNSEKQYEKSTWNVLKGKPMGNVFYIQRKSEEKEHPTQKPEKLIEILVKISSNERDLVGDFFVGSGTTLVCAKKLRRKYFGCEIEPKYYEIAKRRLESIMFTERNIQDYWK